MILVETSSGLVVMLHDTKQLVINCPNVTFTDMDDNNISDGERMIYTSKEFIERMEKDGIKGVYGYYRIVY